MAYLLLVLTVLFWSGNFVLGRGVHELIGPVSLAFWRWLGALVVLLPFTVAGLWRQRALLRRHWKLLTLLSLLSVTFFNTFIYIALNATTVVNTVLVNSFTPVLIVCVSWVGFRDAITARQAAGVFISLGGLLWILCRGEPAALLAIRFSTGDLWTLAAGVSWAVYSVLLRKRPAALDQPTFLAALILLGSLLLLPLFLLETLYRGLALPTTASLAVSVAYMAVFPSVLSYLFWNRGVSTVGANRAGIFVHLMPVFSIIMAFLFLGERLQPFQLPGIALIFCGIFLTTYRPAHRAAKTGPQPQGTTG
jgi:drug/metabolite transporter (DMT)-like permease